MSVPVLTFFNNKGGVGKTSLVYHLSWMLAQMNHKVVAVDLDAQANLTSAFLDEDDLENLWERQSGATTIYRAIEPITQVGDLEKPILRPMARNLNLIPGDVALAAFEDTLSEAWPNSMGDKNLSRPLRIITAFWQVMQMAAEQVQADLILVDVGSNSGAINRSALIASDYVAIPLGADLFSLQGLKIWGPTLRGWRDSWNMLKQGLENLDFPLPEGGMKPLGYIVQQPSLRLSRIPTADDKWINRMPSVYHEYLLQESTSASSPAQDPDCLATLKHYRSLIPMAQEARKPIFELTTADGAIGSHAQAVTEARRDFAQLAVKLLDRMKESDSEGLKR